MILVQSATQANLLGFCEGVFTKNHRVKASFSDPVGLVTQVSNVCNFKKETNVILLRLLGPWVGSFPYTQVGYGK